MLTFIPTTTQWNTFLGSFFLMYHDLFKNLYSTKFKLSRKLGNEKHTPLTTWHWYQNVRQAIIHLKPPLWYPNNCYNNYNIRLCKHTIVSSSRIEYYYPWVIASPTYGNDYSKNSMTSLGLERFFIRVILLADSFASSDPRNWTTSWFCRIVLIKTIRSHESIWKFS